MSPDPTTNEITLKGYLRVELPSRRLFNIDFGGDPTEAQVLVPANNIVLDTNNVLKSGHLFVITKDRTSGTPSVSTQKLYDFDTLTNDDKTALRALNLCTVN